MTQVKRKCVEGKPMPTPELRISRHPAKFADSDSLVFYKRNAHNTLTEVTKKNGREKAISSLMYPQL